MEERFIKRRITGANANKQEKGSRLRLAGALGWGAGGKARPGLGAAWADSRFHLGAPGADLSVLLGRKGMLTGH